MKRTILTVILTFLLVPAAFSQIIGGPVVYDGHEYYLVQKGVGTWQLVEDYAIELGGHLATINDADEETFLVDFILANHHGGGYWMGLYRQSSSDPFVWVNGDPVTYTNWGGGPAGNCVQMITTGPRWEIWPCSERRLGIVEVDPIPAYSCVGFEPPMASGPVTVKGNRALPLKAQLSDADGYLMTDLDLVAPPVFQVWYEYGTPDADDVSDEALPAGQSTEGNQFFFDSDQRWHYNLKTKNYTASGAYTVFMDSGDDAEYHIDPTCIAQFVVK